ncbi:hypothetical protein [Paenibacillus sp. BC26]|uniref:hypothetical protein n=1 Tax=Paenibacillus sp. BC26 TaxID=1881032 RepID=UPI0008EB2372|nr:hypothetical protein [Paenibacillus sp. BC26]SFS84159.1 hypothetical protein SAMN05428962_3192 [Paenibacillus sp. BC26]
MRSRFAGRSFLRLSIFLLVFIVGLVTWLFWGNQLYIKLSPLWCVVLPILYNTMENLKRQRCERLIRKEYKETPIMSVEAWGDAGYGFLSVTKESIYFVPQKGSVFYLPHHETSSYGYDFICTAEAKATTPSDGASRSRKPKVPVFYVDFTDHRFYFQSNKNKQFYHEVELVNRAAVQHF